MRASPKASLVLNDCKLGEAVPTPPTIPVSPSMASTKTERTFLSLHLDGGASIFIFLNNIRYLFT